MAICSKEQKCAKLNVAPVPVAYQWVVENELLKCPGLKISMKCKCAWDCPVVNLNSTYV